MTDVTTSRVRQLPLAPLAVANLVANIGIVVTGGAVRLTSSGLGCPTWPRCTEDSYRPHGELEFHSAIEFGNRLLTFVLIAVAIACWVAALQPVLRDRANADRRPLLLATVIALGVPFQAVIGGVTVLTALNPWVVSLHLLLSMAMIAVCVVLVDHVRGRGRPDAGDRVRRLAWAVFVSGWVVLYLGTVVTGSGPHSGDENARRTGLDPQLMSHVHAVSVYLLLALTIALLVVAQRASGRAVVPAVVGLLVIELAQGVIGFVQYFNDLPELLVGLHLLGAALTSAALTWVVLTARPR